MRHDRQVSSCSQVGACRTVVHAIAIHIASAHAFQGSRMPPNQAIEKDSLSGDGHKKILEMLLLV